jgi:hypothetical protein
MQTVTTNTDKLILMNIIVLVCMQCTYVTFFAVINCIGNPPSHIKVCGSDLAKEKVQMSAWNAMPLMKES